VGNSLCISLKSSRNILERESETCKSVSQVRERTTWSGRRLPCWQGVNFLLRVVLWSLLALSGRHQAMQRT